MHETQQANLILEPVEQDHASEKIKNKNQKQTKIKPDTIVHITLDFNQIKRSYLGLFQRIQEFRDEEGIKNIKVVVRIDPYGTEQSYDMHKVQVRLLSINWLIHEVQNIMDKLALEVARTNFVPVLEQLTREIDCRKMHPEYLVFIYNTYTHNLQDTDEIIRYTIKKHLSEGDPLELLPIDSPKH